MRGERKRQVSVALTDDEYRLISSDAARSMRPISGQIRYYILRAAGRVDPDDLVALAAQQEEQPE